MVLHKDSEATIDGILAVARREVLILAAALQSKDDIGVVISSGRLRWAISCAHEFAGRSPELLSRTKSKLSDIEAHAQRWLPEHQPSIRDAEHLQQAIAALSDPYLGSRAVVASNTLLVGFDLDGLPLANMKIIRSTISQVTARGARLDLSDARGATIISACLSSACLRQAVLSGATIERCDFSYANLEGSKWRAARTSNVKAQSAMLFHADIKSAQFVDCDFRDADFQGFADSGTAGARFIACDLRRTNWHGRDLSAASFVRCKFHGAYGAAKGLHLAHLEENDMSADGDGSAIVGKEDLLKQWYPMGGGQ